MEITDCFSKNPFTILEMTRDEPSKSTIKTDAMTEQLYLKAKYLRDELIVVSQVCSAVNAAIGAMTVWQVGLKGFGARHCDCGGRDGAGAKQNGPVCPGRLAGETVEHAGEGRGDVSGERRAHLRVI